MCSPGWQEDLPWVGVNQYGMIVAVNQPFADQLGWAPEAVLGQPLQVLIPPLYRDAHNHALARFIAFEKPALLGQPIEVQCLRPDGAAIPVELQLHADKHEGEWCFGALLCPLVPAEGGVR
ncbi:MAG: PAS domain-containing protein [Bryobacterales bacterium]|nr:PAS domain-containing protein [Bryobacterales bacterium]